LNPDWVSGSRYSTRPKKCGRSFGYSCIQELDVYIKGKHYLINKFGFFKSGNWHLAKSLYAGGIS
jgi:hypothetical protein